MFGQNEDDTQQVQDDSNNLGQTANNFGAPAPGAPMGPLSPDPLASMPPVAQNAPSTSLGPDVPDDLLTIKQDALQELTPLVGHLEQTPEEKFRTTMMMIQATDDHSLIKEAYQSAKAITDEKARAQALLDVVNEINYFTQHHDK